MPVTPAPTHHSAKKWVMLHPDYKGGDGELLWNIYYGDFADDERFDSFRKDQLWDANVVRPIIAGDAKFDRFQLAESVNVGSKSTGTSFTWLIVAGLMMVAMAAYFVWKKRPSAFIKLVDRNESEGLLKSYATY